MEWLSILLVCLISAVFITIVVCGIINKIKGKSSCSCGGNCGVCGMCHSASVDNKT